MTSTSDIGFDIGIDLDAERERRAVVREVTADMVPIRLGGEVVAMIPTELPLDVLAPIRRLDDEVTLLVRTVMDSMRDGASADDRWMNMSLVVDILAANPQLPTTLIDVVLDMAKALFGEDGLQKFTEKRPSTPDIAFLIKRLAEFYGMALGESRPSSTSLSGAAGSAGETSKPTSSTTTASTSEASGDVPEIPGSSEPAAS